MVRNTLERLETVRQVGLLADLSEDELTKTARVFEVLQFAPNERIVEEGTTGPGFFILHSGRAKVLKAAGDKTQTAIATLRPGDPIGEMSLVSDLPTSATVRADGEVTCFFMSKSDFMKLVEAEPTVGRKVLWRICRTLTQRLIDMDRRYVRIFRRKDRRAALRHRTTLAWTHFRILTSYLWVWFRKKIRLPHSKEKLSRIHRKNARRFKEAAFKLKGANIKVGQMASLQVHLLPMEFIEEFRDMRDQVSATEYPLVAGLFQDEFGLGPLDIFDSFDKLPVAAASMGQVHAAELKSGERLAVKVLHPGLERSVEIDLSILRQMIGFLSRLTKTVDLKKLYQEYQDPLRKELDLLHEGKATEEIAKELEPLGVIVPKVYWRYSTRRVLTLQFIDGVNLDNVAQMDKWGVDRKKLAQTYAGAFLHQAFKGGFFHCDPHPANAFCTPDGRLALLDFGMVKRLPDRVREGLLKEMLGGFFNNPTLYADGIISRGVVGEPDRERLEAFAKDVFSDPSFRSALFDRDIQKDGDMKQLFGKMTDLLKSLETFETPQDELMFIRAMGIVIEVCRVVVPETPVSEVVMPVMIPIFTDFLTENPEYAMVAGQPTSDEIG